MVRSTGNLSSVHNLSYCMKTKQLNNLNFVMTVNVDLIV